MLLFLERIASLTVICRDSGTATETTLTRAQHPFGGVTASEASFAHVDLGDLGAYVVASAPVAPGRLHDAVGAAQHAKRMSANWDDWDDAVVSLAVPTEGEVTGRIFTFLPMGDKAPSPFAGHLNAPFFTKLDRADLDPGHPLNDLLLDVAAETALAAATAVQTSGVDAARRWVSDLVCWDGPYRRRLAEAADRSGVGALIERPFVPIEVTANHKPEWASLADTYRWPAGNLKVLTATRAAEDGTCLLESTLSRGRIDRWEDTAAQLDCPLSPDAETLTEYVERIAASLERPAAYEEPGRVLRTGDPRSAKRKPPRSRPGPAGYRRHMPRRRCGQASTATLLPCSPPRPPGHCEAEGCSSMTQANSGGQQRIAAAGGAEQGPAGQCVPAARPRRDTVAVAASLRQHLFNLHPAIAEHLDSAARAFLVDANLVYSYDIRNLLDHVGAVFVRTKSDRTHRDALRFVFSRSSRTARSRPVICLLNYADRSQLMAGTMVDAGSAAFGPGWDGPDGLDLAAVIEDAGDLDRALPNPGNRLVDPLPTSSGLATASRLGPLFSQRSGSSTVSPARNHRGDPETAWLAARGPNSPNAIASPIPSPSNGPRIWLPGHRSGRVPANRVCRES